MSQTPPPASPSRWCAQIEARLMAAIDAASALAETSDKARLCGQLAGSARNVAALTPAPKASSLSSTMREAFDRLDAATAPIARAGEPKGTAAQAVAMRSALRKLKRR